MNARKADRGGSRKRWALWSRSSRYSTTSGTATAAMSTVEPHRFQAVVRQNGAAGQTRHRGGRIGQQARLYARALLKRLISTGWKTSATGAFPASCGGGTASRVWYCEDLRRRSSVRKEDPNACPKCGSTDLRSGRGRAGYLVFLRALAVLHARLAGQKREDLKYFYPTDVLVTRIRHHILLGGAHDFLAASSIWAKCRFTRCLLHGIVRDAQGRKMSKSLGQRHRSHRGHRQVRRGRAALSRWSWAFPPGGGHPHVRGKDRGLPQLRQQDLERQPLRADEPGGLRDRRASRSANKLELCRQVDSDAAISETVRDGHRQPRKATISAWPPPSLYDFIWSQLLRLVHRDWPSRRLNGDDRRGASAPRQEVLLCHVLTGTLKLLHPVSCPSSPRKCIRLSCPRHEGMLITAQWPEAKPEYWTSPPETAPHGGRHGSRFAPSATCALR